MSSRLFSAGHLTLAATFAVGVVAQTSSAALLPVYEPFNYDPATVTKLAGQKPDAGHTWYQAGPDQPNGVPRPTAGNLTMPDGMPAATGNHAIWGGNGESARLGVVTFDEGGNGQGVTSGKVYYSLAITVTNLGSVTGVNPSVSQIIAGFNNTPADQTNQPSALGAPIWITPGTARDEQGNPTTFRLGFSSTQNTADRTFETDEHPFGTTLFVVGEYELNSGTKNDGGAMWINPTMLGADEGNLPSATFSKTNTSAGGNDLNNVSTFMLYRPSILATVNVPGVDGMQIDELRVGDTFASVTPTPEPATAGLLVASGAMLLARRRRRMPRA
jgi:hypothetical protein